MEEIILEAIARPSKSGKFKEKGFVPGVLYGEGIAATTSVKFEALTMKKIIAHHGTNAKVWIKLDGAKMFGFVKEVQHDPLSRKLLHVDVQMVAADQKIQINVPINFIGEDSLKIKQLHFQTYKTEATITGNMQIMPESIDIDVSAMEVGDSVTLADLKLDAKLEIDDVETVYGMVGHLKVISAEAEETDDDATAEVAPAESEA